MEIKTSINGKKKKIILKLNYFQKNTNFVYIEFLFILISLSPILFLWEKNLTPPYIFIVCSIFIILFPLIPLLTYKSFLEIDLSSTMFNIYKKVFGRYIRTISILFSDVVYIHNVHFIDRNGHNWRIEAKLKNFPYKINFIDIIFFFGMRKKKIRYLGYFLDLLNLCLIKSINRQQVNYKILGEIDKNVIDELNFANIKKLAKKKIQL